MSPCFAKSVAPHHSVDRKYCVEHEEPVGVRRRLRDLAWWMKMKNQSITQSADNGIALARLTDEFYDDRLYVAKAK